MSVQLSMSSVQGMVLMSESFPLTIHYHPKSVELFSYYPPLRSSLKTEKLGMNCLMGIVYVELDLRGRYSTANVWLKDGLNTQANSWMPTNRVKNRVTMSERQPPKIVPKPELPL